MTQENESKYQKRIITIPNILSMFRLCLIPLIVWLYCAKQNYIWTIIMLILSGVTDVVDGFVARRFHMVSDFGKALDPIADKLTQIAVLSCLVTRFSLMLIPLIILIVKELFAGITGLMMIKKTKVVRGAVWHGKATTVLLYLMMLVHLFWYDISPVVSLICIMCGTAMMLLSAVLYGIRNIKILLGKSADGEMA